MGFGPLDWDLGLKTKIWASRLGFRPRDWDSSGKGGGVDKQEGGEGENSPHV